MSERPRHDSNMRHTVPETDALSPELRGRDASEDSDERPRRSASVAPNPACRTNTYTSTIDSSWLIRSSSWPNCWHRRLPRSPVAMTRSIRWCGPAIGPTPRPTARSRSPSNSVASHATWPTMSSPPPISPARRRSRLPGPGFINVTFDEAFLKEQLGSLEADERLGVRDDADCPSAWSSTTRHRTSPRRCTSVTCARRSSATRWFACSSSSATR